MKKNKLELKFSTQRKLSKKEKRKAFHVRKKGKKVQQRSFEHGQAVRKNMTFYWDNVLIETRNVFPFNEVMSYIELDQRRKPRQVKVDISPHAAERLKERAISAREVEDAVQLGLQVDDVKANGDKVFFNKYFYHDDVCVIGTTHRGCVSVVTAYRITAVGDVGFLKDALQWLARSLSNRSDVTRFYVVDRTAVAICAQDPIVQRTPAIFSALANLPVQEREQWADNEALINMSTYAERLKKKLNVMPWDSRTDMGTTFNPKPDHDYSFLVEIDMPKSGKLDDITKQILKNSGLNVDKYPNVRAQMPGIGGDTALIMFDLRDFSGDPHFWAQ